MNEDIKDLIIKQQAEIIEQQSKLIEQLVKNQQINSQPIVVPVYPYPTYPIYPPYNPGLDTWVTTSDTVPTYNPGMPQPNNRVHYLVN